jgi:hypothetical protein
MTLNCWAVMSWMKNEWSGSPASRGQPASVIYQLFNQSQRVALVRMRRTDWIHGNIRIDQNHARGLDAALSLGRDFSIAAAEVPYPISSRRAA